MPTVALVQHDFRHAREILHDRPEWDEFSAVTASITDEEIIDVQHRFEAGGKRVPAGGQTAVNLIFRQRLQPLGWEPEPRLFDSALKDMRGWKMDFYKARVGVEVSFNHAEAIPWTFTRLNLAGESRDVLDEHKIDVGIACFATSRLKSWAKMDGAVGTFELACVWLELMRPIMPIPVLVLGLDAPDWPPTDAFRGTRSDRSGLEAATDASMGGEDGSDTLDDADD
jgi:hypothetical protein